MNLGTLLSSAGQVSAGMREAEENERIARENQLKIEAQNRTARELTRAQSEAIQPSTGVGLQLPEMPITRQVTPAGVREPTVLPGKPAAPAAAPEKLTYESVEAMLRPGDQRRGGSYRARKAREQEEAQAAKTTVLQTPVAPGLMPASMVGKVETPLSRFGSDTPDTLTAQDIAAIPTTRLTIEQWRALPVGEKLRRMKELEATRGTAAAPAAAAAAPTAPATAAGLTQYDAPTQYDGLMQQAAEANGLDPVMFKRLIGSESSFNPNARSPRGDKYGLGIGQIAAVHGLSREKMLDPATALPFAAQLFKQYLDESGGDYRQAILRYKGATSERGIQEMNAVIDRDIFPEQTTTATPAAPARAAEEQPRRNVYLENPQMIPVAMQQALQQRNEIARMANIYLRMGTMDGLAKFEQYRGLINQADNSMMYLQGMQGLQEFSLAGDPRRLSAVWSHYAGANVAIQPRSDGNYDLLVDEQTTREGLTFREVSAGAQKSFDEAARRADQEFATFAAQERFKSGLKREEAGFTALAEIEKAIVEGEYKLAEKLAGESKLSLTVDTNAGVAYVMNPVTREFFIIDPEDIKKVQETPLGNIPVQPRARPVAGLRAGK